ncbi:Ankyrin repeat and KH domain-containing protein mask [Taenia solium]|eukprot:TsM_000370000 transcript=TsM_000370000 gene=TsM_000370000
MKKAGLRSLLLVPSCCLQFALEHAALNDHMLLIRLLLMDGADINCSDTFIDPPIFAALHGCYVLVLEYFLSNGVDIELRNSENLTPLMAAAKIDDATIVDCLLAAGTWLNLTLHGNLPNLEFPLF